MLKAGGEPVDLHLVSARPGEFGPGAYLEFLGRAHHSLYSDVNVYELSRQDRRKQGSAVRTSQ